MRWGLMTCMVLQAGSAIFCPIPFAGPGPCEPGVIASVFNQMGSMFGSGIIGAILFAVVFVIGHAFNIAINLLGAYVHPCRLQYVEFFGKFYEGGGREFNPFRSNTKYVDVKEETRV